MLPCDTKPSVTLGEIFQHRDENLVIVEILDGIADGSHELTAMFLDVIVLEELVVGQTFPAKGKERADERMV